MSGSHSPLTRFSSLLPAGAKVLDIGWEEAAPALREQGFVATRINPQPQEAFHLLRLERGAFDAIWAAQAFKKLPPEGCQRTLATFFQALKPAGVLFLSFTIPEEQATPPSSEERPKPDAEGNYLYRFNDFASLLRQSGFTLLEEARNLNSPQERGALARRI